MNEIVQISRIEQQLAQAVTPAETRRVILEIDLLLKLAKTVGDKLERVNELQIERIGGIRQAGGMLAELEKGDAGRPKKNSTPVAYNLSPYKQAREEAQLSQQMASFWRKVASVPEDIWNTYQDECIAAGSEISLFGFVVYSKQATMIRQRDDAAHTPVPTGKYRCIVIDPPWDIEKIERDVRPNQWSPLDYGTMTLEEIAALPVADLAYEEGCHLYLWTTHRYLPDALRLVAQWGFNYQCLLTWVKPGGMTPYSWMYNTELVVFARRGDLPLLRNGLKLSFEAPATGHSMKPDLFYRERACASPEPRLDMFARSSHEGFSAWGHEQP
jgi:N6-adenosine-specific RNA methylase IME4